MKIIIRITYCLVIFLSACSLITANHKNVVIYNNFRINDFLIVDTNRYIVPKGDFLNYFPHDTLAIDHSDSILDDWKGGLLEEYKITDTFKIMPQRISKHIDLTFFHYDGIPNSKAKRKSEYLKYYDQIFEINRLFSNNIARYKMEKPIYLFIYSPDYFKFNGEDFILLTCEERVFRRDGRYVHYILMKIKDRKCTDIYAFYNSSESINCFGDYNNDGLLDYMGWGIDVNTIYLYSLKDNKFSKDKEHYIIVEPSDEQKEYWKLWGKNLDWYTKIDLNESKWFFPLNNKNHH
jgi:hypothetical protein